MVEPWLIGGWLAFVAFVILLVRLRKREEGQQLPAVVPMSVVQALDGYCALCNAPLSRAATRDQVVFDLERRIALQRAAIADILLQPLPGRVERLYLA